MKNKHLIDFVKPYYKDKDIMHNLSHIERVLNYVYKIIRVGKYSPNIEVLTYAAYFHGLIYSYETEIVNFLQSINLCKDKINKITQVSWESLKSKEATSLEGMILHDAHMIEGGKNYLVVKSLITGSLRGQTLNETILYIENNILDKGECYLPYSKEVYSKMQDFSKEFIRDLKAGLK